MPIQRWGWRLRLTATLAVAMMFSAGVLPAQVRTWTDQQGRKLTGRLVRVEGKNVVFSVDGREQIVPLDQLSDEDQALVRARKSHAETPAANKSEPDKPSTINPPGDAEAPPAAPRVWSVNGRQITGAIVGVDDDAFYLQSTTGQQMRMAYSVLTTPADTSAVVDALASWKRPELAATITAAFERNTGRSLAEPDEEEPSEDAADPPAAEAAPRIVAVPGVVLPEEEKMPTPHKVESAPADAHASELPPPGDLREVFARYPGQFLLGSFAAIAGLVAIVGYGFLALSRGK